MNTQPLDIVTDKYLLDMGFSIHFINHNSRAMGSLRTSPRKFIRAYVDDFLRARAQGNTQREKIAAVDYQTRKTAVYNLADSILKKSRFNQAAKAGRI